MAGIVRVTHSREDLVRATEVGLEKKREGYSPEALVLAIDEVLDDLSLSRAIVLYVQTRDMDDQRDTEGQISWFSVPMSTGLSVLSIWLTVAMFRLVSPHSGLFDVFLIVLGQAILLRLALRGLRLAVISACDGLNNASYPTNLHPLRRSSSAVSTLRLRRLRALISETSDRLIGGADTRAVELELADVNLTPRAAAWIVRLAQWKALIKDYLPPYENRWLGWLLAIAFVVTCLVILQRTGDRLADGYQNYASALTGWIAVDLAARPRRRLR